MLSSSYPEYKEALGILADSSQHIVLIAQAIKSKIIPKLVNKHSMIDVGAGMGILTQHLETEFQEITVLDINPEVEKDLRSHNYDVKICDFFKFETDKKFDFVLCSHVMYHLDETQMKTFIDKLYSLVNPGGYCFIALIGPYGNNHDFHIKFNPDYVNSQQIIRILEKHHVEFERIEAIPHHITTSSNGKMRSLLKFFLVENCLRKSSALINAGEEKRMDEVLDAEVQKSKVPDSDNYDISQRDDYLVLQGRRLG
jgi:SAM-dependent methyltransferase